MASVEKLGEGKDRRYRVHYRTRGGQGRSQTFKTEAEARAFKSKAERDLDVGAMVDPKRGRTTVENYGELWLAKPHMKKRPSTRARDESYMRSHVSAMREATRERRRENAQVLELVPRSG